MRNLNRCEFIGRVGKKTIRVSPEGKIVATLSLGIAGERIDKAGNKEKHTTWVRLIVYEKLSEIVEKYVNVGDKIFVAGRLRIKHWKDIYSGKEAYRTDFIIGEIEMLESIKNRKEENNDKSMLNTDI